ncbi:MAG TPA: 50S ribosomal protein L6 [Syntrophales bacterium]|nr:50S ribosomal protein L6 [Syntrophales bacterium]
MSRIGKKPIVVPADVKVSEQGRVIRVEGPLGTLSREIPMGFEVSTEAGVLTLKRLDESRRTRSLHGLMRTLVANMVTGVSTGFQKALEISGIGYRAEVAGDTLRMYLGFSRPVEYKIPEGITVKVDRQVNMVFSGIDKEFVGRVAAEVRALRKPEPYKGKGVRYQGEKVRRKVGKSAGA